MKNEKIAKKILQILEKNKNREYNFRKFIKLILKNRNNEELWDILLQSSIITEHPYLYLTYIGDFDGNIMSELSIAVQKKLINFRPYLLGLASDELRSDRSYMEELQRKIDSKEIIDEFLPSVYEFLGSKLYQDKEFMLSLREKYPLAFLKSMKEVQYDDETLKTFFDKHPEYIEELPNNLKYNYDYVARLILKLGPKKVLVSFGDMRYDYLKNPKIKQAIIKIEGEDLYKRYLLNSLLKYPEQLKNISQEELKELIMLNPELFIDRISNSTTLQHILSTGLYRKHKDLIKMISSISQILFKQIDTPQKLSNILFKLSKTVSEGLTYENIFNQVNSNWQQILPWIKQIDKRPEMDDGGNTFEIFYILYNLLSAIESNKLDQAFKLFINSELRVSRYGSGIKNINVTDENLAFLQFSCTCSFFKSDTRNMEMYTKLFLKISKWNNDPYLSLVFIDEINKDVNLKNLLLNTNIEALDQELLINIFSYVIVGMNYIIRIANLEELRDYSKVVEIGINNIDTDDLEALKDKILLKYFQINLFTAESFIHSYLSSDINLSLYQSMPEVKYLKDFLEKIINAKDTKTIEDIDKSLTNQNARVTLKEIYKIIENIKKSYGKVISSSLLQVNNSSGIIDVSNIDFNLLVHVIGAYGAAPAGDVYDSWNTKERTSSQAISTSFISSNNMGIASTNEHSVILGFNNIPDGFVEIMSYNDLYSGGFVAIKESRFSTPDELKNNTRHGHNEIVIRRRKGEYSEEKIEPSYIICFDSVNEESKIAAQKFGVPIIFIDREKVAERQYNEIIRLKEQFKTTLNPRLISKIICEQENNKAGLRLGRPDLVEKYFSTEFRQKNIEELYSIISAGLNTNNPNAINAMNEFVKVIENEAQKFKTSGELKHRKNFFDINYQEFLQVFKSHPAYKQDFELPKELRPEEIYQKFIECRGRLAESERMELQYINSQKIGSEEVSNSRKVNG